MGCWAAELRGLTSKQTLKSPGLIQGWPDETQLDECVIADAGGVKSEGLRFFLSGVQKLGTVPAAAEPLPLSFIEWRSQALRPAHPVCVSAF